MGGENEMEPVKHLPSNQLLRVLSVHSAGELLRYKSFFVLILIIIGVDRLLQHYSHGNTIELTPSDLWQGGEASAVFLFDTLPGIVSRWLTDVRALGVVIAVFVLKQIISLWPSSDMRRMHRRERTGFGVVAALLALKGKQLVWDAVAVGSVCLLAGAWILLCYLICRGMWLNLPSAVWSWIWLAGVMPVTPLIMAGFSYSSKVAVLAAGGFFDKLSLFFKLFSNPRILGASWLFFLARIAVEFLFVVAIPGYVLLTVEAYVPRIIVAGLSATLVYAYLKMATFKFFLFAFRKFDLVQQEYADYYRRIHV